MEHCPQCDTKVSVEVLGAYVKCESCGMRFPKPRRGAAPQKRARSVRAGHDDGGELGIHPALARRYQKPAGDLPAPGELTTDDVEPMPSVQLSPSLVEEARQKRAALAEAEAGNKRDDDEAATAVESKPGALSVRTGPVASESELDELGESRRESTRPLRPSFEKPSTHGPNDTPVQRPAARTSKPKEPMPELPNLQMIEQVGKGAMGRVFRARDEVSGDDVAVKLLAPELAARPDFVARFQREAAALKRVSHSGVVAIRGSGSYKEHHYLVMEFIEGVSLRRILDGGPLTPGRALHFARQITQGLGAAHSKSVIHRDLKPENILVENIKNDDGEEEERLVLVDFGLAGIIDEGEDPHPNLTKSRMTMGTVNYMAPEQRTDAKRVDQRADLYAAGVILYELLTGDLPLGRFALPRERGLPLPESVDDCVHKALARNPDERFLSATDLDDVLGRIQSELSRAASMDTLVGRSMLMDSEAEYDEDEEDSLSQNLSGNVRSLMTRSPADDFSTASGKNAEWHTAPPWVKRPELLWGVLALAVGAGAGVYLSTDDVEPAGISGPALLVADGAEKGQLSFAADDQARWLSPDEGWSAGAAVVRYEGKELTPADPRLLFYADAIPSAVVSARVLVDVDSGTAEGAEEPASYGGVMIRSDAGLTVGVMRFSDGTCGVLELDAETARVSPFRCPTTKGPMEVGISCTRADNKCLVDAGGAAPAEYEAVLGSAPVTLALACAGRRCSFENPAPADASASAASGVPSPPPAAAPASSNP